MNASEGIDPALAVVHLALEGRFYDAAKLLVQPLNVLDGPPSDPAVIDGLSDLALAAFKGRKYRQVLRMIDDRSIRRHLRQDFIVWRSAFARVADAFDPER